MAALTILFAVLFGVRLLLALRYAARPPAPASSVRAAVLQPVLSGDPALPSVLAANAEALPHDQLYWLVDDDDPAGQAAAAQAARPNVTIVTSPGPADGENPKVAKLARVLPRITEEITVVLDDDTRIDSARLAQLKGALAAAPLVTGLPVFTSRATGYERFIGGFVNGNAALTYLPAAATGSQHTINGMIYAVRTDGLRSLGGFDAIRGQLTDDYAIAQLYESHGLPLLQTSIPANVGMTVVSAAHCARVLRRWFVFANRYMGHNASPAVLFLIALPALLPPAGLWFGPRWLLVLAAKALVHQWATARITGLSPSLPSLLFEILADLFAPFFYLSALIRPSRITWRSRRIAMDGDRIRYQ